MSICSTYTVLLCCRSVINRAGVVYSFRLDEKQNQKVMTGGKGFDRPICWGMDSLMKPLRIFKVRGGKYVW